MKKKILFILETFVFIMLISIYFYRDYRENNTNFNLVSNNDTVQEVIKEELTTKEEIALLQNKYNNKDIKGTLEIINEDYKTPILQTNDNSYYLKHLPNKEYSSMGSTFLDYRVNIDKSKKLLIFGHNSSKKKMPFQILENYYNEEYFNTHKNIVIKTMEKVRYYEVFSVYVETSDFSYMKVNFNSNKDYLKQLESFKNKSWYKTDTVLDTNTNILLLQTCSTHKDYKSYKKKYLILVFKEVNESDVNYSQNN